MLTVRSGVPSSRRHERGSCWHRTVADEHHLCQASFVGHMYRRLRPASAQVAVSKDRPASSSRPPISASIAGPEERGPENHTDVIVAPPRHTRDDTSTWGSAND